MIYDAHNQASYKLIFQLKLVNKFGNLNSIKL